jgi:DNA-binding CsgD family transcriptional regulator
LTNPAETDKIKKSICKFQETGERKMQKDKKNSVVDKYTVLQTRFMAVINFFFWVIAFLFRSFVFDITEFTHIIPVSLLIGIYVLSILFSIFLIIWPRMFYFYAIFWFLWGILNLVEGYPLGVIECLLACLFAYLLNFFKTGAKIKGIALVCAVLAAMITHAVLFDPALTGEIVLKSFEFILGTIIFIFFCLPKIQNMLASKQVEGVPASDTPLSKRNKALLQMVAQGEKYKTIAQEYKVGRSTIIRWLDNAYRQLGVRGKEEFLAKYAEQFVEGV